MEKNCDQKYRQVICREAAYYTIKFVEAPRAVPAKPADELNCVICLLRRHITDVISAHPGVR